MSQVLPGWPEPTCEKPLVRYTAEGIPWIEPQDILLSRRGQEAIAALLRANLEGDRE